MRERNSARHPRLRTFVLSRALRAELTIADQRGTERVKRISREILVRAYDTVIVDLSGPIARGSRFNPTAVLGGRFADA